LQIADTEDNIHWQMARKYKIEEKLRSLNCNAALQGEIIGFGVQKNMLKLRDKRFYAFQLVDIDKFVYYNHEDFISKMIELDIPVVPMVEDGLFLTDNIDELVKYATCKSRITPEVWAEGVVIRPKIERVDLQLAQGFGNGRVSFKVMNPEYLLKGD
jgi:hypothetical protein